MKEETISQGRITMKEEKVSHIYENFLNITLVMYLQLIKI